jgi:hypothetical protein
MTVPFLRRCVLILMLLPALPSVADVIINEVMYHPPEDRDDLQFIELHNPGSQPVALRGWSFRKGIKFTFPEATLAPGGFAVVCRDEKAFGRKYGTNIPVLGSFTGQLKHGGERLELTDAAGAVAEAFKFADTAPWPTGGDGDGASLERITPAAPAGTPENWAASTAKPRRGVAATPGRTNSVFSANLPPAIRDLTFAPVRPGAPTVVTAVVEDADRLKSVELLWQSLARDPATPEHAVPMQRVAGNETAGTYRAELPAQPAERLLRFRVRATDAAGASRFAPAPGEPRPSYSAFVSVNTNTATIPQVHLLQFGPEEQPGSSLRVQPGRHSEAPLHGQSAFVYFPTNGGPMLTFDHVRLTPRPGGWKVRLHSDQPLDGMTTLNLTFEDESRWALSEPLAYEVFRRAGVPTPLTDHLRVWRDGRPVGYHLLVEQPNKSFLRRTGHADGGNLYKLLWYGDGVVEQHEKKNNPETGHKDLLAVIEGLNRTTGDAQWEFIQQNFNVPEMVNYFAVSMCIENWDGFFNNYFAWHDPKPGGKWEIFPWDQDKTWGDYDDCSPARDWYTMPLTFGMNGDREPVSRFNPFRMKTHPWGTLKWWRPGGYFSGPLLANPQFRQRFLQRLRELCETKFSEKEFLPVIDELARRLEPEVRFRAKAQGEDSKEALAKFNADIDSFRGQLKHRRAFILAELDKLPAAK